MSDRITLFVNVILPIAVRNDFTYRVPFELNEQIGIGMRVVVPFGKGKLYTAIITKIHEEIPVGYQAKFIEHLLDATPITTKTQHIFWKWISDYYMAPIGDVLSAALPSNFKLASETKIVFHPDFDRTKTIQNERMLQVVESLDIKESLDLKEISELLGIKTVQPLIKQMLDAKIIISLEELNDKYVAKTASYYFLDEYFHDEIHLYDYLEQLEGQKSKEKQLQALLLFLQEVEHNYTTPIAKKVLEDKGASKSALETLVKNNVLFQEKLQVDRIHIKDSSLKEAKKLSVVQQKALDEIQESFKTKDVCLLHGVTGSGKTEIYIDLIQEQLEQGKQVLFLFKK